MLTMGRYAPVIARVIFPLIVRGVNSGVVTGDGDELAIDRTACHRLTSTPAVAPARRRVLSRRSVGRLQHRAGCRNEAPDRRYRACRLNRLRTLWAEHLSNKASPREENLFEFPFKAAAAPEQFALPAVYQRYSRMV